MLSILVVNWNTREKLLACLGSLELHRPSCDHETIVVDNASSDGSAEAVANLYPDVKLIRSATNAGYAKGNNRAFENAKGEYLLTLNPDTEFCDSSIDVALRALIDHPEAGSCAIRLVNLDGTTQSSVRGFPSLAGVFGQLTGLDRLHPGTVWGSYSLPGFDYGKPGVAPQPMGTFLLLRRSALAQVGDPSAPFDERFPIFFNEVDLLYRLHQAGLPCWYEPSGRVLHHHGASTSQVKRAMVWESHKSLARYWMKHWRGAPRLALPFVAAALWVAAFVRAKGYHAGFRAERHDM